MEKLSLQKTLHIKRLLLFLEVQEGGEAGEGCNENCTQVAHWESATCSKETKSDSHESPIFSRA